jgi:hypothetical protein
VEAPVTITLSKAEALVLFELLSGFRDEPHLSIRHDAERVLLWMIQCSLEQQLVEPFSEEYANLWELAREQVLAKWGAPGDHPKPRIPQS